MGICWRWDNDGGGALLELRGSVVDEARVGWRCVLGLAADLLWILGRVLDVRVVLEMG